MSHVYSPIPVKLEDITLVDDGDPKDAAGLNVPIEAIADGVAYLQNSIIDRVDEFLLSGTWTCPIDVHFVELEGCGGGGGGGTGGFGSIYTLTWSPGGSGGGAAQLGYRRVEVTPGTVYAITIAGSAAADTNGGSTTFGTLATFKGGEKGHSETEFYSTSSTTPLVIAPGTISGPTSVTRTVTAPDVATSGWILYESAPGSGGASLSANGSSPRPGRPSITGFNGGAGGTHGSPSGGYQGGGGGGGGGGGPYGVGGAGGNGPDGKSSGTGTAGAAGTSASANTGGGGGGGGGGGAGPGGVSTGGAGGAGGSGRLYVSYRGIQAVVT